MDKVNTQLLNDLNSNPSLSVNSPSLPTNDPTNPIPNCTIDSIFHDSSSFIREFQNSKSHILASVNIQSLHSKHQTLKSFLAELSYTPISILALQETWSIPHPHLINIPGFNFSHSERKIGRGGGVGFYVKDDLNFKIIPELSLFIPKIFECITIEVQLDNKKSSFSSIYRSPSDSPEKIAEFNSHLDHLLFNLSSIYQNSYICLDSNFNSLIPSPNLHQAEYFTTIIENGFIQCINKATRISNNSSSLIDHIITNSSQEKITSGVIISDISDHFMTFIQLPLVRPRDPPCFVESRVFSGANIGRFRECLGKLSWRNVLNTRNVDDSYNLFWTDFKLLYDQNFPVKKTKFNKNLHKICNYMTQGLLVSRLSKIKLHKISIQSPSTMNIERYKKFRNIYNSVMRASKKLYFEKNLKLAKKNPKKSWQLIKEAMGSQTQPMKINEIFVEGACITDPPQIANSFNKFFASAGKNVSNSVPPSPIPPEDYFIPNNTHNLELGTISPGEVADIIKESKSKVSTDIDGLSMKLLKKVAIEISSPLAHIFNLSLKQGIFPSALKSSKVVPLHKAGPASCCDNYRPIALVSTISKILEKFVSIKLTNHLELNKLIHPNQFGFQRMKNTEQNLLNVINVISSALNGGEYCIGIFLDLKKAFDCVNHEILLKKLKHLGVRGLALEWFRSYLSNRSQRVYLNGELSDPETIDISVLQGTILGPILFLCFINDLPNSSDLITFLFADDTQGLASGKNLPELMTKVNTELRKWALWFQANRMAVNTNKTKYIIFHTKGKKVNTESQEIVFDCNIPNTPHNPSLISTLERIHNNHPITESQSYKLLGIYLDENLTFHKNTTHIISKMSKSIFCINRAKHFLPQSTLITLYQSLVHSHLLYCPLITSCSSNHDLEKIFKIQKKAIRIVTNSSFHAHTAPLFAKHKILPLNKIILQAKLHLMHSIYYNYAPPTLKNMCKKNSERSISHNLRNQDDYTIPRANYSFYTRFPLYTLPLAWNNAGIVTFYNNTTTFKIALLNELHESNESCILNQPLSLPSTPPPLPHSLLTPPPPLPSNSQPPPPPPTI